MEARYREGIGLSYRPTGNIGWAESIPVPEFINQVFAKTSSKRSFSMTENERLGLVIAKTGSIISAP